MLKRSPRLWKLGHGLRRVLSAVQHLQANEYPEGVPVRAIERRLAEIHPTELAPVAKSPTAFQPPKATKPMARNNIYGALQKLIIRRHIRAIVAPRSPLGGTPIGGTADLYLVLHSGDPGSRLPV